MADHTPTPEPDDEATDGPPADAAPQDPAKRGKATQAEAELRAMQVLQWILAGAPRFELVRLSAEQWGVNERQAQKYIARARQLLLESSRLTVEEWVAEGVAQRQQLYALAMESGDLRTALTVLIDLGKLARAYPPQRNRTTPAEQRAFTP